MALRPNRYQFGSRDYLRNLSRKIFARRAEEQRRQEEAHVRRQEQERARVEKERALARERAEREAARAREAEELAAREAEEQYRFARGMPDRNGRYPHVGLPLSASQARAALTRELFGPMP